MSPLFFSPFLGVLLSLYSPGLVWVYTLQTSKYSVCILMPE